MLDQPQFHNSCIFAADSTCLVWAEVCGERTHCQLYDTDQLRQLISWVTSAAILLSTLCDVCVWRHVTDLRLYDDTEDTDNRDIMSLEITSELSVRKSKDSASSSI